MGFEPFSQLLMLFVMLGIALGLVLLSLLKGKRNPDLLSFIGVLTLLSLWLAAQILRVFLVRQPTEGLLVGFEFLGACFLGLGWLLFCLFYTESAIFTGRNKYFLSLLLAIPVFCYFSALGNPRHHLVFGPGVRGVNRHSILFWVYAVISYGYCLGGTALLFAHSAHRFGRIKKQSFLLAVAAAVPVILNLCWSNGASYPGFDIPLTGVLLSLIFLIIVVVKYRFLDIVPIDYHEIMDTMKEAVAVIDDSGRIIKTNQAFIGFFPEFDPRRTDLNAFIEKLCSRLEAGDGTAAFITAIRNEKRLSYLGELCIDKPDRKWVRVDMQPLYNGPNSAGRLLVFSDVTEYRQLLKRLNGQNLELSVKNQQLKDYAAAVEELAVSKERNRLARDVHDTMGQTMTLLVTLLQICSANCGKEPAQTAAKLNQAVKIAQDGLTEIRRAIAGMAPEKLGTESLFVALQELAESYISSGLSMNFFTENLEGFRDERYSDAIYRICQESLTNSLRHGKARNATIILRIENERLRMLIMDDGTGCKEICKGFGLSGMEKRVQALGGKIIFNSSNKHGFHTQVELPLAQGA